MLVSSLLALVFSRRPTTPDVRDRGHCRNRSGEAARSRHARRLGRGLASVEALEARLALTVDVTNLDDSGTGSLRAAIEAVNTAVKADTISFNKLGVGTIALTAPLPALTNPAGTTFAFGAGTTAIVLDGAAAGLIDGLTIGNNANNVSVNVPSLTLKNFNNGLKLLGTSTNSLFSGLTITNNINGISLEGGTATGTKIVGSTITSNSQNGILATGGVSGLTIGGTTPAASNTISLNGNGLFFQPGTYSGTVIQSNTITSNTMNGITLGTSGGALTGLTIGGSSASAANTISFNRQNGVQVSQGSYSSTVIQGNTIASNGGYGVQLAPAGQSLTGLTIGGTAAGTGNTIASNAVDGIGVFGGTYTDTAVQGNTIQYNQNHGVNINPQAGGAAFTGLTLGGTASAGGNTIKANGLDGVLVNAGAYTSTNLQGNTITGNGRNGVTFATQFGDKLTGLQLGGTSSSLGNTITNNAASGLAASKGDYTGTRVLGNTINANRIGISLTGAQNLFVGGVATAFKNTIDSNTETGLFATGTLTGTLVRGNSLTGNPLGVSLLDAQGLSLGTAETGGGNTITGGTTGIQAVGNLSNTSVSGNVITGLPTGMVLINAVGTAGQPFLVGNATTQVGTGAGNYVVSTVRGMYAAGPLSYTTVAGNTFIASGAGGSGMVLENARGITVGGATPTLGNLLTASQGNALWASGNLAGTGVYGNNLTGSQYGVALVNAQTLLVGVATNPALKNTVQYNRIGLYAVGNCTASGVCYTTWYGNVRKVANYAVGLLVYPKP